MSSGFAAVARCPRLTADIRSWPNPLAQAACHGLAGEIVAALEPHSEADPAALLMHILVAFGSCVGRAPYFCVEADQHHLNLYALFVGATSKARKGIAWGQTRRLYGLVDEEWVSQRVQGGLSSGEGLIAAVRDPLVKPAAVRDNGRIDYQDQVVDPGVTDKRLLVLEPEFASTLRVMGRDGNTLSATVRQAWDYGDLRVLTKNTPAQATGAHISIIGHVTGEELRREITRTDLANGFANRFLFICVRRSRVLPEGGALKPDTLRSLAERLGKAVQFARATTPELRRNEAARQRWAEVYPQLSEGRPGLLGAVTGRAEAQVVRLSLLYALLDQARVVDLPHLEAALALWDYAARSAEFVFGAALGEPVADELWRVVQERPNGMTRAEMYNHFARHCARGDITDALKLLAGQGLVERRGEKTGGRPTERWVARKARKPQEGAPHRQETALNALNALSAPVSAQDARTELSVTAIGPGLDRDIPPPEEAGALDEEGLAVGVMREPLVEPCSHRGGPIDAWDRADRRLICSVCHPNPNRVREAER